MKPIHWALIGGGVLGLVALASGSGKGKKSEDEKGGAPVGSALASLPPVPAFTFENVEQDKKDQAILEAAQATVDAIEYDYKQLAASFMEDFSGRAPELKQEAKEKGYFKQTFEWEDMFPDYSSWKP